MSKTEGKIWATSNHKFKAILLKVFILIHLVGLIFLSSFLLLTFLIPVSLNVSIEVIKGFLGIFLSFDRKMISTTLNKHCSVNNISILDELGQIDYVLTDKTGTLTANEMIFKHLSIGNMTFTAENLLKSSK